MARQLPQVYLELQRYFIVHFHLFAKKDRCRSAVLLLTRSTKTPTLHRRRASPRSTTRAAERLVPDPPAYRHPSLPPLPRPASPFLWGVTTRPAQTICPFRPAPQDSLVKGESGGLECSETDAGSLAPRWRSQVRSVWPTCLTTQDPLPRHDLPLRVVGLNNHGIS